MKNIWILIFLFVVNFGCGEKNPCEEINCINGGTCFNGGCSCPPMYEGVSCENERTPEKLSVSKIEVLSFPLTANGESWDSITGPDLQLILTDQDGNSFESEIRMDYNETGPLTFDWQFDFPKVQDFYSLVLIDLDDGVDNDLLGGIINFLPYIKGDNFPSTISFEDPLAFVHFRIHLTYKW